MRPLPDPVVLRPRELVVDLFARALDGDTAADDDLRELAPHDERADAALAAIVVAQIEGRYRADPDGRGLPPTSAAQLERALAAIDTVTDGPTASATCANPMQEPGVSPAGTPGAGPGRRASE